MSSVRPPGPSNMELDRVGPRRREQHRPVSAVSSSEEAEPDAEHVVTIQVPDGHWSQFGTARCAVLTTDELVLID